MLNPVLSEFAPEHYFDHPIDRIEPEEEVQRVGGFYALLRDICWIVIKAKDPSFELIQFPYLFNSIHATEPMCKTVAVAGFDWEDFNDSCFKKVTYWRLKPTFHIPHHNRYGNEGHRGAVLNYLDSPKVMGFFNQVLGFLLESPSPKLAAYQVSYALGFSFCNLSMSEQGRRLGYGHAAISKGARDFIEANGLRPSALMRDDNYAEKRRENMNDQWNN